jgi:parallel beta-helix repeat protein
MKSFKISQKRPGRRPHEGHVWMGVCIIFACFAFAGVVSGAANLITGPAVISVPGTYILANDITNSNAPICIQITASNVVLDGKGYSIDGIDGANSIGIKVYNSAMTLFNVIIKNLDISDWGTGILLQNVKNSQVQSVTATSNTGNGIALQGASRNVVNSCTASSNGGVGIILYSYSDSNTVTGNTAQGNDLDGIRIRLSSNNDILKNKVANNKKNGINLNEAAHFNTITENTITGNKGDAVTVYKSNGNIISKNTIDNNDVVGIRVYEESDNNEISRNTITNTNNYDGISIYTASDDNMIFSNTIENSAKRGIWLQNANRNSFYNNVVKDNIDEGLYLTNTSSNVFVNNYFYNNKNIVVAAGVGANTWNLSRSSQRSITGLGGSGGNYWGQPDGKGFSQVTPATRGICDQPYVITNNNIDKLPLS